MHTFTHKKILITAGAAGIGRAVARAFIKAGAAVHIADCDSDAVADLQAEQPDIVTSLADVAFESEVARVFQTQRDTFGGLDLLVNCAGIAGPTARLQDLHLDDWRRCIAVNLDAVFLCSRAAIPLLHAAGKGAGIINFSSTAGRHGFPLRSPYSAAKWGVIGLTKSLAMELGPAGIRVNAICPGSVEGERMDRVIAAEAAGKNLPESEVRRRYTQGVSLRTMIAPEEIADAVLFLASPAAAKITGQALNVDAHLETLDGVDE